ncbi:helix-turn-helix domain-containing protein [Larkinella arboricola]
MTEMGETITQKGEIKNIASTEMQDATAINYTLNFFGTDEVLEKRDCHQKEDADACSYEYSSPGVHIWYGTIQARKKTEIHFEVSGPCIQMVFSIQSTLYGFDSDRRPVYNFSSHEHNILLVTNHVVSVEVHPEACVETLLITLTPDLFFSYFAVNTALFAGFQKNIGLKIPTRFSRQNLPITPRISVLVNDILHCSLCGDSKRLFLQAKVMELLAVQLDQYEQCRTEPVYPRIKKEEVEKMHQVQQLMLENPEKTFSLKELSKEVGTNEYNLKKHFKQVFGNTVFGYLQTFRMEKAKEMLSDGKVKVAEVSRLLGYKHATHFTAAFKKHFGFLPNKIKGILLVDLLEVDLTVFLEII